MVIIKTKSIREPTEKDSDGLRIFIARLWPRGLSKGKENWNEWWKDLAPSKQLLGDYKRGDITWPEYEKRFSFEIKNNPKSVDALKKLYGYDGTVTLLCYCKDENYCHRSLVKRMVIEKFWLKGNYHAL